MLQILVNVELPSRLHLLMLWQDHRSRQSDHRLLTSKHIVKVEACLIDTADAQVQVLLDKSLVGGAHQRVLIDHQAGRFVDLFVAGVFIRHLLSEGHTHLELLLPPSIPEQYGQGCLSLTD